MTDSSGENFFDSDTFGDVENLPLGESDEINLSDVGGPVDGGNEIGDAQVIKWNDDGEVDDESGEAAFEDIAIEDLDMGDMGADDSGDFIAAAPFEEDDENEGASVDGVAMAPPIEDSTPATQVAKDSPVADAIAMNAAVPVSEDANSDDSIADITQPEEIAPDARNEVADITEPVPTRRSSRTKERTPRPARESKGLGKMLTIPLVLAVIGGLGYGGFTMLGGSEKTAAKLEEKPLENFQQLEPVAKVESLADISATLDRLEEINAAELKALEAKVDAIAAQSQGADIDLEIRLLRSKLKLLQPSSAPDQQAQQPDNASASLGHQPRAQQVTVYTTAIEHAHPLVWMTHALIGYDEPKADLQQLKSDAVKVFKAGRYSAAVTLYLDLAEAELSAANDAKDATQTERLLDRAHSHLNVAEVVFGDARRESQFSKTVAVFVLDRIDDLKIQIWAAKRKLGTGAAATAAQQIVDTFRTDNARTINELKTQVAADVKTASDTAKAAQSAVAALTSPNGELANLKNATASNKTAADAAAAVAKTNSEALATVETSLKANADGLKATQDGLKTVQNGLKMTTDTLTAQADRQKAMGAVLRAAIQQSFRQQIAERLEAVEPKTGADLDDDTKQAVAQKHVAWKSVNDQVTAIKSQLSQLNQKSNDDLLSSYVTLQQAERQLGAWEAESRLAASIAAVPVPGPTELADTVVSILGDQIQKGILVDVQQLKGVKIPKDLIGKADARKVIEDVLGEFNTGNGGVTPADLAKLKLNLESSLKKTADSSAQQAFASAGKQIDSAKQELSAQIGEVKESITGVASSVDSLKTDEAKKRAELATVVEAQLKKSVAGVQSDVENVASTVAATKIEFQKNLKSTQDSLTRNLTDTRDDLEKKIEVARTAARPLPADQVDHVAGSVSDQVLRQLAAWGYVPIQGPPENSGVAPDLELARQLFQDGYDELFGVDGSKTAAQRLFAKSVQLDAKNPVYRYFLGLAMHVNKDSVEATKQIFIGAKLEREQDLTEYVAERLERVQFDERKWLDRTRVEALARLTASQ